MSNFTGIADYYVDKRVLVTGAAGFIGSTLCTALGVHGADVYGIDLKVPHNKSRRYFDDRDITDLSLTGVTIRRVRPDIIFHLAAETEVGKSFLVPHDFYKTNVLGTLNILEYCKTLGIRCVVASTDKVYGPQLDYPSEIVRFWKSPSPYAESKRIADELCSDYREFFNLDVRVVRSVNTYGPGQKNATTLITRTVKRILNNERPEVSDQDPYREWLYIDDAVSAFMLIGALECPVKGLLPSFACNVGSGERLRCSSVVDIILATMGKNTGQYSFIESNVKDYNQGLDSSMFRTCFPQWKPTKFSDGIVKTLEWYMKEWTL